MYEFHYYSNIHDRKINIWIKFQNCDHIFQHIFLIVVYILLFLDFVFWFCIFLHLMISFIFFIIFHSMSFINFCNSPMSFLTTSKTNTVVMCGYRLVVRTSRCGREDLGSNPSSHIFFSPLRSNYFIFNIYQILIKNIMI